ncbi:metalloendopeptidase [Coemansia spiralis]|uniref:Metalloendopeptidase n=2 Tax=Coemansia TaxID=4863 RepID=A0A9W8G8I5_9FUNG|nr:Prd1 proteinase [Coemansia spiralis]KAJ1992888.1 metalloendopeptidase [Coemansia umbellata]KAJ2622822.1 metalloendopeptidase [Coemansia sp. RSA 1358]KAJ2678031.1 metalloendopeptidase [Coemansia spiralis]
MASRIQRLVKSAGALNFRRSPSDIASTIGTIIARGKEVQDQVAAQTLPTFANTIAPLARFDNDSGADAAIVSFLQNVSTDKLVRDASSNAEQQLQAFRIEAMMREDVYRSVSSVFKNSKEMDRLEPEDRLLVEKMELQYRRNGLALSSEQRQKLGQIRKRLSELGIAFARNINESDGRILLTREELDGLPDDYFDGRKTEIEDGLEKYVVTTKYPDLVPAMQHAKRESTRRRLLTVEETRCPENIPLLQEAVGLRLEAARLLGYKTHAEFVLEENMAKTPEAVLEFEHDLRKRLDALADKEVAEIEAIKKADKEAAGEPYDGLFNWDFRYYSNLVKERKHSVSDEEVKQYFPMKEVTRGVLDIYQEILGLRFVKVENPDVWHSDVEMYEVWEAKGDDFVGHFYLDLYPREGKYNHACVNSIRASYSKDCESCEYPAAVMLANFPKPTSSAPALLKHDDVLTLLHEFGHVFHHLCTKTKWSYFQLDSVQVDFIEAPSQMLENWGWEPSVLRKFAVHYKTGEPIPEELVKRLLAAKNEGAGLFNMRQAFFGLFDMAIHNTTDGNVDIRSLYRSMREEITRFAAGDANACGAATFGHMMGGYDAGYYGYQWAKVFSADMYASRFLKDGVDNPQTGMVYRREILQPGGSRNASASLEMFLGRKPNNDAFLKSIGLD